MKNTKLKIRCMASFKSLTKGKLYHAEKSKKALYWGGQGSSFRLTNDNGNMINVLEYNFLIIEDN